ncbi:hypothetical protein [Rurimicrobium arvi]|uniref:Uncharacterized protein n=1 Tax=Rurimicrobium arvi TaxID=2049916 RepID=A0ABP8MP90_9BACT
MFKHTFFTALLVFATLVSEAQKPQPILSFAREQRPLPWYKEQAGLWKKEIDKDNRNATAWLQYFRAVRVVNMQDPDSKKTPEEKDAQLMSIVDDMEKAIPGTYEYNLSRYSAAGLRDGYESYLLKAQRLEEGHTEHYDYMVNQGEITRDTATRNKYCLKLYESGQVSTGMMNYNRNVLAGLAPGAILITVGDNDTYPAFVLQAMGFRKDVAVINMSLIRVNSYREKLFKELGIAPWQMPGDNASAEEAQNAEKRFEKEFIKTIIANKQERPVYLSLTSAGCDAYAAPLDEHLHLTGLAYKYSEQPVDDIGILRRNFEQEYMLDYLKVHFYKDISTDLVQYINLNYVVPMLKLYDHYQLAGETQRARWIGAYAKEVVKGTEYEQQVTDHLKK